MTIDQLDDNRILVTLMRDDIERYCLRFDDDGDSTRRGLTRLMVRVGEACGLDHRGKSYLIEALPAGDSCLLIISVRALHRRRRYRIKRVTRQECFVFATVDDLLDWLDGDPVCGRLYRCGDGCWLLPDCPVPPRLRRRLSEYAQVRELSAVEAARVRETGCPLGDVAPRRVPHRRPTR